MRRLLFLGIASILPLLAADNAKVGQPGKFDHYLLTLSWSPAYCANASHNDPQCAPGRNFTFVLHGLWPQYSKAVNGKMWPQFCTTEPGLSNPKPMLDIMPSEKLIAHEWAKHGTCSGLGLDGYFAAARKAFNSVKTPPRFVGLNQTLNISPAEVKKEILGANPALAANGVVIACSAKFLSEVRICLDKDLKPIPCAGMSDCKTKSIRMPPVR